MSVLSDSEEIVIEFLRANITDPRGRYSSDSDSFTASAGQTDFVLTPSDDSHLVRAVKSVSVNGNSISKWQDYDVDLRNKKVILGAGASEDDVIVVNYYSSDSGDEWIFPDRPISKLGQDKFPRISVEVMDMNSNRLGNYSAPLGDSPTFKIICHVKDNYNYSVSGKKYSKQGLANYLGYKVKKCFSDSVNELYPKFYDYSGLNWVPLPFDEESQTYMLGQDVQLSGVDVGE